MLALAAANVNDSRSLRQAKIAYQVVEQLGPAWVQADVKRSLEVIFQAVVHRPA